MVRFVCLSRFVCVFLKKFSDNFVNCCIVFGILFYKSPLCNIDMKNIQIILKFLTISIFGIKYTANLGVLNHFEGYGKHVNYYPGMSGSLGIPKIFLILSGRDGTGRHFGKVGIPRDPDLFFGLTRCTNEFPTKFTL